MARIITNEFSTIFSFHSPFFIVVTCFYFDLYCFQSSSSSPLLSRWACKLNSLDLFVAPSALLRLASVICNVVQLTGLLVVISLCLPTWWSSLGCFFLHSSEISFSDLYRCLACTQSFSGLCWVVVSCGFLRLAFVICIIITLAPSNLCRVVSSCDLHVDVGLQGRWLALLSLLGHLCCPKARTWWSSSSCCFLYSSCCCGLAGSLVGVVAFAWSPMLFQGLHLVVFVFLLLLVVFVASWACKVAGWRYCLCLVACEPIVCVGCLCLACRAWNNHQYDNVGVDFSLCCIQIAEFSDLGRGRVLSN